MRRLRLSNLVPKAGAVSVLALVLLLAACGGSDESGEEPAGTTTTETSSGSDGERLKVAAVFTVPLEQQWASVVTHGLQVLEDDGVIEYTTTESTPGTDIPRVVRQYAEDGYDLIVAEAHAAEEEARRVAADYPDIAFFYGSTVGPTEPNVSVFGTHVEEPTYLCGMLAGGLTKTNKIGFIGGYPIGEVNWLANAFIDGAREVNPDVKYVVTYLNTWFDPPKTKEATLAQIESGVDVIFAERTPAVETAAEKKILAAGAIIDLGKDHPDTAFCSALWNMDPVMKEVVEKVQDGSYAAEDYSPRITMGNGAATQGPYYSFEDTIPDDLKSKIEERRQEIVDGSFKVEAKGNEPPSSG